MVVRADGQLAAATVGTAGTAAQAGAVAGSGLGTIGQVVPMSTGNSVPGSAGMGSGGNAPITGGGKKLVGYGSPDTVERLAADAARAESTIGYHGVSAMLRNPPSFPHGQADFGEAAKFFAIIKTGTNPSHYTVILPKPITQDAADLFNSVFRSAGS